MILTQVLFGKQNFMKVSDKALIDEAVLHMNPRRLSCPCCGARMMRPAGSYSRSVITVRDGARYEFEVDILRVRCENCEDCTGCVPALIPDNLIPYGSYSIKFVLTVLRAYLTRTGSVAALCDHWGIAISTLYGWIHSFTQQFSSWAPILERIEWLSMRALQRIDETDGFCRQFLKTLGFPFLVTTRTDQDRSGRRRRFGADP